MIAVGVDPGTRRLGWGIVARRGRELHHVAHGVIALDAREPLGQRLRQLEIELGQVLQAHQPNVGSVETLFFHKDAQAAAKLGHARGVVLLSLARAGIAIAEYAPARVKRTIAGHGQADKRQVATMIRALLRLGELPALDASDALALAVTHLRLGPALEKVERSSKLTPALLAALSRGRRRPTRRGMRLVARVSSG